MAQMASGEKILTGTFTTPSSGNSYTFTFGKTFTKYMYLIEMTDASKTALAASGETSYRMFACIGIYPSPEANNSNISNSFLSFRTTPSTGVANASGSTSGSADGSSVTFTLAATSGGTNVLYRGYTYKYTVVPID